MSTIRSASDWAAEAVQHFQSYSAHVRRGALAYRETGIALLKAKAQFKREDLPGTWKDWVRLHFVVNPGHDSYPTAANCMRVAKRWHILQLQFGPNLEKASGDDVLTSLRAHRTKTEMPDGGFEVAQPPPDEVQRLGAIQEIAKALERALADVNPSIPLCLVANLDFTFIDRDQNQSTTLLEWIITQLQPVAELWAACEKCRQSLSILDPNYAELKSHEDEFRQVSFRHHFKRRTNLTPFQQQFVDSIREPSRLPRNPSDSTF